MASHQDLVTLESRISKLLNDHTNTLTIAKYISYEITGCCDSEYNQDLESVLKLNCPVRENHRLINILINLLSLYKKNETEIEQLVVPIPSFNLRFKNQEHVNRPDINFLYKTLKPFHNSQSYILDLYVDETFGSNYDVYKVAGIVPYNTPWYGFIHSSFVFSSELESSLRYCKGLFVFSEFLKKEIQKHTDVKIFTLYLPVAEPSTKFDIKKMSTKIIQINSEYENTFSFYKIDFKIEKPLGLFTSKNSIYPLEKLIIGNFDDKNLPDKKISNYIKNSTDQTNLWNRKCLTNLDKMIKSVRFIRESELDVLLSQNIVFSDNTESFSAIRALSECIVRNTPILISRHPIAVELLGEKYPLFYSEGTISFSKIKRAHKYLIKLNKTKLNPNTFLCRLNELVTSWESP